MKVGLLASMMETLQAIRWPAVAIYSKIGMLRGYRYRPRARRFHAQQLLLPSVATEGA
jgi:hypothetical protein